ncbi:MAG: hypothetical protein AB2L17_17110 [Lentimicrobium sp.]
MIKSGVCSFDARPRPEGYPGTDEDVRAIGSVMGCPGTDEDIRATGSVLGYSGTDEGVRANRFSNYSYVCITAQRAL